MVHKFKVKKEFYRDVKKEGLDETPEFYKEIFGESQDNDDQTHESDSDSAERSKGSRGVKRKVHDSNNEGESDVTDDEEENVKDGVEKEYDLGAESSDDDEEEKNVRGKGTALKEKHSMVKGAKEKPTKRPRFNPYAKLLKQREEDKKEREKAVEQAKKEREVREKGRKAYYDSRETERRRLTQKTSRGQPVMRNQVKHLLAKIKKMDEV